MRRRTIHTAFGAAALGCALVVAYQSARLHEANRVNAAIASASVSSAEGSVAEAELARARALAASGDTGAAVQLYKTLIQGDRADLKRVALYNLGNLHLRAAMEGGAEEPAQALPRIELAKQSYRDLLRIDPTDWDARYNLERALWLAPEVEDATTSAPPQPPRRAISTAPGRIELP